jgi:hypothetical protein
MRRETAPSAVTVGQSSIEVTTADFLLAPDAFVDRCLSAYDKEGRLFTSGERVTLVEAVRAGRPRIEVLDAIRGRSMPGAREETKPRLNSLAGAVDSFVHTELLERYAPDDDEAFIRQIYFQVFGRQATPVEAVEAKFDLKAGRVTRREMIENVVARSPNARLSTAFAGDGIAADGKSSFVLVRAAADGWAVAPDLWIQPAPTENGAWRLEPGWVLAGPKRTFRSGPWRLDIDILQPQDAQLVVEVAANSGLDLLLTVNLVGPARLSGRFTIGPWHHFLEVRLRRPEQRAELNWLRIRDLSLVACG